jgi:hypothetical protein
MSGSAGRARWATLGLAVAVPIGGAVVAPVATTCAAHSLDRVSTSTAPRRRCRSVVRVITDGHVQRGRMPLDHGRYV